MSSLFLSLSLSIFNSLLQFSSLSLSPFLSFYLPLSLGIISPSFSLSLSHIVIFYDLIIFQFHLPGPISNLFSLPLSPVYLVFLSFLSSTHVTPSPNSLFPSSCPLPLSPSLSHSLYIVHPLNSSPFSFHPTSTPPLSLCLSLPHTPPSALPLQQLPRITPAV